MGMQGQQLNSAGGRCPTVEIQTDNIQQHILVFVRQRLIHYEQ
jgi:hypothetical protein